MITGLYAGGVGTFVAPDGRPMTSGIRKWPIARAVVTASGLPGDASTEADHHTAAKTVHIFADENYRLIEERLGHALPRPAFGENITATGLLEDDVCVGDMLRCGTAVIVVTQPTERCKAVGRNLGLPKILKAMHDHEVCGFYASVVTPGGITVGDTIERIEQRQHVWTVKRLHRVMFKGLSDDASVANALALPELSDEWKTRLRIMRGRLSRGERISSAIAEL